MTKPAVEVFDGILTIESCEIPALIDAVEIMRNVLNGFANAIESSTVVNEVCLTAISYRNK